MSSSKLSPPPLTRDNIGTSTSRFTEPLVLKVIAAFVLMLAVLVILTIVSLYNINQGKDSSHQALDQQTTANQLQRLREALVNERVSLLNTLYTGQSDPRLSQHEDDFQQEINILVTRNELVYPLIVVHDYLKEFYTRIISTNEAGRTAEARALWEEAEAEIQKLLGLLDTRLNLANSQAMSAATRSDTVQTEAAQATLWLALVVGLIGGLVVAFVMSSVIGPLRRLNDNLTQLLWKQTGHLTDQLNVLQAEVNINRDMLTTVRHDLKSPLSSIKGLAELSTILHPDLPEDVYENLDKVIEMADLSVATISEVLARREQQLELKPVNLSGMVDKVLQLVDLRGYSVQRNIEAREWTIDPSLMEHALLNLLSNARKFSLQGIGVGLRTIRKPGTVDTEELEVWVWNDGALINAEDRAEIFKPGKQTAEGKQVGGHGLGLYIVKSIVERHHGRVTVESHEKKGTTFHLYLPRLYGTELSSLTPAPQGDSNAEDRTALVKI